MKTLLPLCIVGLMTTFWACNKQQTELGLCETPPVRGQWEHSVRRNDTLLEISTTDTQYWWFDYISKCLPTDTTYLLNMHSKDVTTWEGISVRKGGKGLLVDVSENQEGVDRSYLITIQSGNCYSGVRINQPAN